MIKNQRINLKEFCQAAEAAGCRVIRAGRSRCYAVDAAGIAIVTTTGAVKIPIRQVKDLLREINLAADAARNMWAALTLADKNQIAREQGTTYGKMQQVFYELKELGGKS